MTTFSKMPFAPMAQTMSVSMGGTTYTLRTYWNTQSSTWALDLQDASGNPLIMGLPFITGAGLLDQLGYLGFPFNLYVITDGNTLASPTYANLGTDGNMFVATKP
jgi:hypothetical protein